MMVLNLAGLRALNAQGGVQAPRPAAAPVAPPPPSPPKTVFHFAGAAAQAVTNQQTSTVPPDQSAQAHAATLAREAVYQQNGVTGMARANPPPDIQAAAENAASQAAAHVAAQQAAGSDTASMAIDRQGNVTFASLEKKFEALPGPVKVGAALLGVLGLAKLFGRK